MLLLGLLSACLHMIKEQKKKKKKDLRGVSCIQAPPTLDKHLSTITLIAQETIVKGVFIYKVKQNTFAPHQLCFRSNQQLTGSGSQPPFEHCTDNKVVSRDFQNYTCLETKTDDEAAGFSGQDYLKKLLIR